MAIRRYAGDRFVGLSTDRKPINVDDGAVFYELDTFAQYIKKNNSWSLLTTGSSGYGNSGYSVRYSDTVESVFREFENYGQSKSGD